MKVSQALHDRVCLPFSKNLLASSHQFVDVPELQSPIAVVGYPVGGDSLSITKGIVSRVTLVRYSAAGEADALLRASLTPHPSMS